MSSDEIDAKRSPAPSATHQSIFGYDLQSESEPQASPPSDEAPAQGPLLPSSPPSSDPGYQDDLSESGFETDTELEASALKPELLEDARPRWHGSVRKWRHLTNHDRRLAKSLEKLDADDLAAHLYDAQSIKRGAVSDEAVNGKMRKWAAKKTWRQKGEWVPGNAWAAWPMAPDEVAWASERAHGHGEIGWYDGKDVQWSPGRELEMEIRAGVMRDVRAALGELLGEARETEAGGDHGTVGDVIHARSPRRSSTRDASASADETDVSETQGNEHSVSESEDEEEGQGGETDSDAGTEASFMTDQTSASEDVPLGLENDPRLRTKQPDEEPRPFIDEENYLSRLHPIVKRTLGRLDQLLDSLYKGRRGRRDPSDPASRSRSVSKAGSRATSRNSSRSRSLSRTPRKRKRAVTPGQEEPNSDEQSNSRPTSHARNHARRRYVTRDWSEVIGHAMLSGWSDKVVQRSLERCQTLFQESMDTRIIVPTTSEFFNEAGSTQTPSRSSRSAPEAGWYCLVEDCKRHSRPFDKKRNFALHVKSEHTMTIPEMARLPTRLEPLGFQCPHRGCVFRCKLFPAKRYLRQHFARSHEGKEVASPEDSDGEAESVNKPRPVSPPRTDLSTAVYEPIRSPSPSWLKS